MLKRAHFNLPASAAAADSLPGNQVFNAWRVTLFSLLHLDPALLGNFRSFAREGLVALIHKLTLRRLARKVEDFSLQPVDGRRRRRRRS